MVVVAGVVADAVVDCVFEVDGVAFGATLALCDWKDVAVDPRVISIALVFGVVLVNVFEPLFVDGWLGSLENVSGGLCVGVVADRR